MKLRNVFYVLLSMLSIGSILVPAHAGGFRVEGSGTEETASAGAITARSNGVMSLFINPANLGNLKKAKGEAILGLNAFFQRGYYSNIGQSTWNSEKKTEVEPFGGALFKFKDRYALAIARATTYHHDFEWDDPNFIGRYLATGQTMQVTELAIGGSWKFKEKFAFGLALRYATADFSFQTVRPKPVFGYETFPDSFYDYALLAEADAKESGFSAGLHYTPRFGLELALTYFSSIEFDFEGQHRVKQISLLNDQRAVSDFRAFSYSNPMTSHWSIPERFTLAASFKPTVRTRVELDVSHEGWSKIKALSIQTMDGNGDPLKLDLGSKWNDIFDISLGAEFRHTPQLKWLAGLGFHKHILDKTDLTPGYPVHDRFTASLGLSYLFGNNGISFAYAYHQYRDVRVSGQEWTLDVYSDNYIINNSQTGLFESQRHHLSFAYKRRF